MAKNDLLSTGQVAKQLNCTVQNVSYLCRQGRLQARQVGGRWLVTRADLERYKAKIDEDDKKPD